MNQNLSHISLFLEVLMPYVPIPLRQPLLLFSKVFECMECMKQRSNYFSHVPYQSSGSFSEQLPDILSRLSPFLSESERESLAQMQNMLQMLQMYQMMQSMSAFFTPDTNQSDTGGCDDIPSSDNTASDSSNGQEKKNTSEHSVNSNFGGMDFSNLNPDALLSALSPEQQQMFETLKGMMNQNNQP